MADLQEGSESGNELSIVFSRGPFKALGQMGQKRGSLGMMRDLQKLEGYNSRAFRCERRRSGRTGFSAGKPSPKFSSAYVKCEAVSHVGRFLRGLLEDEDCRTFATAAIALGLPCLLEEDLEVILSMNPASYCPLLACLLLLEKYKFAGSQKSTKSRMDLVFARTRLQDGTSSKQQACTSVRRQRK